MTTLAPTADEGIDTSFWAWAYNRRPGALVAVLTDVGVQRFQLNNVLQNFTTLRETPMWRDDFRDNLPDPVIDLVNNYRLHVTQAVPPGHGLAPGQEPPPTRNILYRLPSHSSATYCHPDLPFSTTHGPF